MDVNIEEVMMLLGKKEIENYLLRKQLSELSEKVSELEKNLLPEESP